MSKFADILGPSIGVFLWTALVALVFYACQPAPSEQGSAEQKRAEGVQQAQQKQARQARQAQQDRQARQARQARQKQARQARQKAARQKQARQSSLATGILASLPVRGETESGYDRDLFEHWSDLDGNGCDGREDVLRAENLRPQGSVCWDERGLWFSAYDGVRTRDSGEFDVDHVVPLAEAWDSGAGRWDDERRERYANDPWPLTLRAVSATSNRSKSDADPAEWMPPRTSFHCRYALEWVAVKYRWRLAIDPIEKTALQEILRDCPRTGLRSLPPRA